MPIKPSAAFRCSQFAGGNTNASPTPEYILQLCNITFITPSVTIFSADYTITGDHILISKNCIPIYLYNLKTNQLYTIQFYYQCYSDIESIQLFRILEDNISPSEHDKIANLICDTAKSN